MLLQVNVEYRLPQATTHSPMYTGIPPLAVRAQVAISSIGLD
jgi:hypothetical protein